MLADDVNVYSEIGRISPYFGYINSLANRKADGSSINSYTYSYDDVGNITAISGSTNASYTYDAQGQLLTETYGGKTYTYTYDGAGNILSVSDGSTTKSYSYGDSNWKDLLTAYNGQAISYDAIGNPTSWYDGTTFGWSNGRRLTSAVNSSAGLNNSYTYDADGLRLTKTVNGEQHKYVWQGSTLVSEYYGGKTLEFFYDESGVPYGFSYKSSSTAAPAMYYYVTNLQGDVTNVLDASGNTVASYTYNAWGKVLTSSGSMASINPIRYRGYYFDSDTGLYYLKSRYYDPQIARFVNADEYASSGQGILGCNMFAYCGNNPINRADVNGDLWKAVAILVAVAITSFILTSSTNVSPYNTQEAIKKFNGNTVSVYERGASDTSKKKYTAEIYYPSSNTSNISIKDSLNIRSQYEQNAFLDVIIDSPYYSDEIYGSKSFMRAQWVAHNTCYDIASRGNVGFKVMQILSGAENPIQSANSLDLRSKNNMLLRQKILYTVISWLC